MANEVKDINMAQNIYFLHVAPHMEGVKVLWNLTELETLNLYFCLQF